MQIGTADETWLQLLNSIYAFGDKVSPRGLPSRELGACLSRINMRYPIVTIEARRANYRFMVAEALWILSGSNQLNDILPYLGNIAKYSDNGIILQGAYGPKVTDQLRYVIETLTEDTWSRQAVINIWRENPRKSKDIPCTIAMQFVLRPDPDSKTTLIHTNVFMRSSDVWLGWVYDVFTFSMITLYIASILNIRFGGNIQLGTLALFAGSEHLYDINRESACEILSHPMSRKYLAIDTHQIEDPEDLRHDLALLREYKEPVHILKEMALWMRTSSQK